jgi:hypothetical protein
LYLLEQCLDPVFWTSIKSCNFVTFYELLIHLGVHHTIDKKFKDLDLYKQGGVTYIKISLDEMFTISNTVVTTIQGFFEAFSKDGIGKVPNKDVRVITEQIVAVTE